MKKINLKINKLPIKMSNFNKNIIPTSIFTNPSHYISSRIQKNSNGLIPANNRINSKGKYIKKMINSIKSNVILNNKPKTKYFHSSNKKTNITPGDNNLSKEKVLYNKSKNKGKENTQNNIIVKKIPTAGKKSKQHQIIRSNNIIVKNRIKYTNLNVQNNSRNINYNLNSNFNSTNSNN